MNVSFAADTVGGLDDRLRGSLVPPSSDAFAKTRASIVGGLDSLTSLDDLAGLAVPSELPGVIPETAGQEAGEVAGGPESPDSRDPKLQDCALPPAPSIGKEKAANKPKLIERVSHKSSSELVASVARNPTWLRHKLGPEERRMKLARELDKLASALNKAEYSLDADQDAAATYSDTCRKNVTRAIRVSASERVHDIAKAAAASSALKRKIIGEKTPTEEIKEVAKVAVEAAAVRKKTLQETSSAYSFAKPAPLKSVQPPFGRSPSFAENKIRRESVRPGLIEASPDGQGALPKIQRTISAVDSTSLGPTILLTPDDLKPAPPRNAFFPLRSWQRRPPPLAFEMDAPQISFPDETADAVVGNSRRCMEALRLSNTRSPVDGSSAQAASIFVPASLQHADAGDTIFGVPQPTADPAYLAARRSSRRFLSGNMAASAMTRRASITQRKNAPQALREGEIPSPSPDAAPVEPKSLAAAEEPVKRLEPCIAQISTKLQLHASETAEPPGAPPRNLKAKERIGVIPADNSVDVHKVYSGRRRRSSAPGDIVISHRPDPPSRPHTESLSDSRSCSQSSGNSTLSGGASRVLIKSPSQYRSHGGASNASVGEERGLVSSRSLTTEADGAGLRSSGTTCRKPRPKKSIPWEITARSHNPAHVVQ